MTSNDYFWLSNPLKHIHMNKDNNIKNKTVTNGINPFKRDMKYM